MADNDRFVIRKAQIISDCRECPHENEDCEPDCVCPMEKGKTRAEYEDIVLETINYECSSVLNEIKSVNTKEIAKAVVDRLFGEGE